MNLLTPAGAASGGRCQPGGWKPVFVLDPAAAGQLSRWRIRGVLFVKPSGHIHFPQPSQGARGATFGGSSLLALTRDAVIQRRCAGGLASSALIELPLTPGPGWYRPAVGRQVGFIGSCGGAWPASPAGSARPMKPLLSAIEDIARSTPARLHLHSCCPSRNAPAGAPPAWQAAMLKSRPVATLPAPSNRPARLLN
jgi:hypothetical protein